MHVLLDNTTTAMSLFSQTILKAQLNDLKQKMYLLNKGKYLTLI